MSNKNDFVDGFLLAIGSAYSLTNLEQVLGVLILIIQLIWISFKLSYRLYIAIKTKKFPIDIRDDAIDLIDFVDDIIERNNDSGDLNNGDS